jgi:hypothetical protein
LAPAWLLGDFGGLGGLVVEAEALVSGAGASPAKAAKEEARMTAARMRFMALLHL